MMARMVGTDNALCGSLFLNELNARTLLLGVKGLQKIEDADPCEAACRFVVSITVIDHDFSGVYAK